MSSFPGVTVKIYHMFLPNWPSSSVQQFGSYKLTVTSSGSSCVQSSTCSVSGSAGRIFSFSNVSHFLIYSFLLNQIHTNCQHQMIYDTSGMETGVPHRQWRRSLCCRKVKGVCFHQWFAGDKFRYILMGNRILKFTVQGLSALVHRAPHVPKKINYN
jgi:hypothetical protein